MVLVIWRDAWFDLYGDIDHDDYLCHTVGWVVEDGPKFLVIAGERTPDGDRAVSHIPRSIVERVIEIEEPP